MILGCTGGELMQKNAYSNFVHLHTPTFVIINITQIEQTSIKQVFFYHFEFIIGNL